MARTAVSLRMDATVLLLLLAGALLLRAGSATAAVGTASAVDAVRRRRHRGHRPSPAARAPAVGRPGRHPGPGSRDKASCGNVLPGKRIGEDTERWDD
jgi:hypothetical protein